MVVKIIVKIHKNLSERKLRFIRREKKDRESDLTIWSILKESICIRGHINFVKEQNILISVNIVSIYEFFLSLSFNLKIRRERDLKYFES